MKRHLKKWWACIRNFALCLYKVWLVLIFCMLDLWYLAALSLSAYQEAEHFSLIILYRLSIVVIASFMNYHFGENSRNVFHFIDNCAQGRPDVRYFYMPFRCYFRRLAYLFARHVTCNYHGRALRFNMRPHSVAF